MARLIQAVRDYGPRPVYGATASIEELAELLARTSGLNPSAVRMVLSELSTSILFLNRLGTPVSIPGLGRFRATLGRDGRFRMRVLTNRGLIEGLNNKGAYSGNILNAERVGWTNAQYKELWDAEHPEDPLEIPEEGELQQAAD
jgi:hypothetical protein